MFPAATIKTDKNSESNTEYWINSFYDESGDFVQDLNGSIFFDKHFIEASRSNHIKDNSGYCVMLDISLAAVNCIELDHKLRMLCFNTAMKPLKVLVILLRDQNYVKN